MYIFKIVVVIIGALIGAGFASGQEVNIFFFKFGTKGLISIFISSFLIGLIIYKTLKIVKTNNIKNYKQFLSVIIKNSRVENIANIIINIFVLMSFYIMIAGFGAYLEQEINLNSLLGSSILAILCILLFKKNIEGVVKVNEVIIPLLLGTIMFLRYYKYKEHKFYKFYGLSDKRK